MGGISRWLRLAAITAALVALVPAAPAFGAGTFPDLLTAGNCAQKDAADNNTASLQLPYVFCDDDVPTVGGTTPNTSGDRAIKVPAR
jgi:hypothetical protein